LCSTQTDSLSVTPKRIRFVWQKGEKLPDGARLVTRSSRRWGNPFKTQEHTVEEHARVVAEYRRWIMAPERASFRQQVRQELRGHDLACTGRLDWPCHANVLLEVANH
jgi:hypothetical protein